MHLDEESMINLQVAKSFTRERRINSLEFSYDGLRLITSGEDDQMVIYDCEKGTEKQVIRSGKYGCDLVHFTHATNTIVYASNKEGKDHAIRYMSLHDNKYLKYFSGHTAKVVSLSVSPVDDTMISGSLDKTVRLWDLRSPDCVGLMQCQGRAVASFDPEGLIFAVGVQSEQIKLYDVRSFEKGPFSTFKYKIETGCDWTGVKFSKDGKLMMLTTNGAVVRVVEAFEGKPMFTLSGYQNNKGIHIEANFTPDSQYVMSGSTDGKLHLWRTDTGQRIGILTGEHSHPVTNVQFNPRYAVMASSCQTLCMWVPGSVLNDEPPPAPGQFPLTSTNNFVVPPPVANRNSNSYSAGIGGGGGGSYQPGLY